VGEEALRELLGWLVRSKNKYAWSGLLNCVVNVLVWSKNKYAWSGLLNCVVDASSLL
jgi:hypothetical protein